MKIENWYKGRLVPPPVYEYVEFPKWITKSDGSQVMVNDAIEEAAHVEKPKRGRPKNDATATDDTFGHNLSSTENS
jgi:hypothetical protein